MSRVAMNAIRRRLDYLRDMETGCGQEAVEAAIEIVADEAKRADFSMTYRELNAAFQQTGVLQRGLTADEAVLHIVAAVRSSL